MSKIKSLLGKPKVYEIGGIELEFEPRTLEDIDLIMDMEDKAKRGEAIKQLISRTIKDADPEATDKEISSISFSHFQELTKAVMDVNGLSEEQ